MPQNCTLNHGEDGPYRLCVFYHDKKRQMGVSVTPEITLLSTWLEGKSMYDISGTSCKIGIRKTDQINSC